ncbi:flagellar motor switch protein FliG [Desulfobotulus sp.]|uniref:flagellar motor switch protein FliG n=1 Tax=Desulfobotulus sp. TaxID=1940337 RepID=UPI002A365A72|nr:flagellar motor switch protein FliG [Desulfobotulus sp.]MDY0163374.1 flagellar motor switch protein FliG [Desulfobotulus sp.]
MADNKEKKNTEVSKGARRAAIFLLLMGEEYASEMFRRMKPHEIRIAAAAMGSIDKVEPDEMEEVLSLFVESFEGETSLIVEGDDFFKKTLEKALGPEAARSIIKEIEDARREIPFDWSRRINIDTLASYVEGEHPQTIAMILAHLPPEVASEILMAIPNEKKGDIAYRIALLGQVPEEVVRDVDEALRRELEAVGSSVGKTGGLQVLVDILNGVDKSTEEVVMELIESESVDMATEIREMMFVFEDLVRVDDRAMREILKKVEGAQLTLALKATSEDMRQKILGNLSLRAAEMLLEDLEVMGPVKLSDVEEAQQAIVRSAKELEEQGVITLGGKGKDDILV